MTKKDYELIANVFSNDMSYLKNTRSPIRPVAAKYQINALTAIGRHLATELAVENPRFDYVKFLTACGIEPDITLSNGAKIFDMTNPDGWK